MFLGDVKHDIFSRFCIVMVGENTCLWLKKQKKFGGMR